MTLKNEHINVNKYTRPGTKRGSTKGIILHYTANPGASADNHRRYFGNGGGGRYAGAHIFIDSKESLCIVPLNEVCYHANDNQRYVGGKPYRGASNKLGSNANLSTIGIEMCIEKDGTIAAATFNQAVEVTADLCKTYKLDTDDLYRHYDITGKNCPAPWVSKPSEWTRFKEAVKAKLNGSSTTVAVAGNTETFYKKGAALGVYRVIKPCSTYSGVDFTQADKLQSLKVGTAFTVVDIVKFGTKYRFKTKMGEYVSAKRSHLKKI